MITVFGSINLDLVTRVVQLPRPGETVYGSDIAQFPGGKGANQALAACRAGTDVRLVGAVGSDDFAALALSELRDAGVDLSAVEVRGDTTGVAVITVNEAGENTIILSPGANLRGDARQISFDAFGVGDTLMLQMEVAERETFAAAGAAKAAGAQVILSLAPFVPLAREAFSDISILLVNETEAADLVGHYGIAGSGHDSIARALAESLDLIVVVTLGAEGAVASDGTKETRVETLPVEPIDTTGAGDTFAGVLAAGLDAGDDLKTAMRHAAAAGALACTKSGAQPSFPTGAEIRHALSVA
ncbi:ribokinase [Pelagibius sp. Alg239-R121]|uniref:ribokinase n=1 Tax=Pelagibius sp. Alg239-R121 TaxID=2993448 RepID=UPI0024A610EC|nr:ribokinase [Pelagibius sp. Alg239-R121]